MSPAGPRILQVALSLNPGGTERLIVDLAARLNPTMPTAVCCLDEPGGWAAELEARGVPVTAVGRTPGFHPGLGRKVAAAAAAHQADVLHAHHYTPFVYSALARLAHPALRVVFTEHGRLTDRGPSPKRRLANRLFQLAPSAVFAVSADVRTHLIAEGFDDDRVNVIYNGIDVGPQPTADLRARVRRDLGLGDEICIVGTIARLDPVKNLGTLIDAAATAQAKTPVHVIVVGDGDERAGLERHATERGMAGQVTFLGHRNDARDFLAGCDVYANSSVSEGVSLTILEAMAAGLPVIATAVGGTPEVIDDTCGRLVPPRSPDAFATALVALARDAGLRRWLGEAARARVASRFTLERMLNEYAVVYRRVAER